MKTKEIKKIIDRNANGEVIAGNIKFKVPSDQSMFAAINEIPIYNGDDFTADPHWILNSKGFPKRKKFVYGNAYDQNRINVWSRKMEPDYLPTLESLYHYMNTEVKNKALKIWKDAVNMLKEAGGQAHFVPDNSIKNDGRIILYNVSYESDLKCYSVGFDWVDRPEQMINAEIGKALVIADKKSERLYGRINKFRSVFLRHLENRINDFYVKNRNKERMTLFIFTINDREYCVNVRDRKYGAYYDLIEPVRFAVN